MLSLVQVTREVISAVVPSEYDPTALNCRVCPFDKLGGGFGVTAIEFNTGAPVKVVVVFDVEQAVTPTVSNTKSTRLTQ